jgi:hypothetical protein
MRRALLLCALAGAGCGKDESKVTPPPPALPAPALLDGGRPTGAATAAPPHPAAPENVASIDLDELEAVESVAAHCEAARCDPKRKAQGKLAAPAPPFLAAQILNSGPEAMEDDGYLFVQTAKGWFVGEFLWSLEEGELQHRVRRIEVADYAPGGSPELVIELEKRFLDSEDGPVMQRDQEILLVCAVAADGAPACVDPREPIVLSSQAEDSTWRIEVTARPDGTLDRKAVEGTPPAEALGPARLTPP